MCLEQQQTPFHWKAHRQTLRFFYLKSVCVDWVLSYILTTRVTLVRFRVSAFSVKVILCWDIMMIIQIQVVILNDEKSVQPSQA